MRHSKVTWHTFNRDPLPPTLHDVAYGSTNTIDFAYGDVIGGDHCLDTADEDASYVRYLPRVLPIGPSPPTSHETGYVITMRATVDPMPPLRAEMHDLHQLFQARLETAEDYTVGPGFGVFAPPFVGTVDNIISPNGVMGGAFDPRNGTTDPYWGTAWWDETNGNDTGDGPGFGVDEGSPFGARTLVQTVRDGGYFVLFIGNGLNDSGPWVRISHLVGIIDWTLAGPAPYLRMNQRDDGLGIRGHARLNVASFAPNQPTSRQRSRAPRITNRNRYS